MTGGCADDFSSAVQAVFPTSVYFFLIVGLHGFCESLTPIKFWVGRKKFLNIFLMGIL